MKELTQNEVATVNGGISEALEQKLLEMHLTKQWRENQAVRESQGW